uniref:Protein kinase domain-containing protein n=1 Tax=Elaeophora elaphi TaxID=1147741 RepID=A0A0R3RPU2_9BILA
MIGRLTGLTSAQEITKNMNRNRQSPMYAAPESIHPEAESLPQDMFAMGVVLYRCIIGRMPKRKPNRTVILQLYIDYHWVKSSITLPVDSKMWHTTQLLMSERLDMRLTAGQLLHTDWIERAATTPITQIFNWNN